jgi:hypothetical protein
MPHAYVCFNFGALEVPEMWIYYRKVDLLLSQRRSILCKIVAFSSSKMSRELIERIALANVGNFVCGQVIVKTK